MKSLLALACLLFGSTAFGDGSLFPETLFAFDKDTVGWVEDRSVVLAVGEFGDGVAVSDFEISVSTTWFGNEIVIEGLPDVGFWLLVRPDELGASWSSGGSSEVPGRDILLP